jgi:hypothetical protein
VKKADILKGILAATEAAAKSGLIPGGQIISGVTELLHRDDDPTNDAEEVTRALTKIVMGGVDVSETLLEKDIVNDEALQAIAVSIEAQMAQFKRLVVKRVQAVA